MSSKERPVGQTPTTPQPTTLAFFVSAGSLTPTTSVSEPKGLDALSNEDLNFFAELGGLESPLQTWPDQQYVQLDMIEHQVGGKLSRRPSAEAFCKLLCSLPPVEHSSSTSVGSILFPLSPAKLVQTTTGICEGALTMATSQEIVFSPINAAYNKRAFSEFELSTENFPSKKIATTPIETDCVQVRRKSLHGAAPTGMQNDVQAISHNDGQAAGFPPLQMMSPRQDFDSNMTLDIASTDWPFEMYDDLAKVNGEFLLDY